MQKYEPDTFAESIIKIDVLEITDISRNEHERLGGIKALDNIGILEKEVLINHNVFIGATAQMMEYAIGQPKHILKSNTTLGLVYYVYFLAGDKKPTFFEMNCAMETPENCKIDCMKGSNDCKLPEKNKLFFALAKAYKRSAIDLTNLDNPDSK